MNIIADIAFVISQMGIPSMYANMPPEIAYVDQSFMQALVCPSKKCNVEGMYPAWGGPYVYLNEANDNKVMIESIFVHEAVHYYQNRARPAVEHTCENFKALEREAYHIQATWLRETRSVDPMILRVVWSTAERINCNGK